MELLSTFQVPACAHAVIDELVDPAERRLIEALDSAEFTSEQARAALVRVGEAVSPARLTALLDAAYRRGVLDLVDDHARAYRVATFYDRLGVFVLAEPARHAHLPESVRVALDEWLFDEYASRLDRSPRPTADRIATLEETLGALELENRSIWLNRCDCRALTGAPCEAPLDTCITFRSGINTLAHRGLSQPLSLEQAKEVVRRADAAGLVHTINEGGICNCCTDCCYLFRAEARRDSAGVWPRTSQVARFDGSACIGCRRCVARCRFGAFQADGSTITYDAALCRGCGLCVSACPTAAIFLSPRDLAPAGAAAVSSEERA